MRGPWTDTQLAGPKGQTFRLEDLLGSGAFGEVYKATGLKTGITVAVKVIPAGLVSDDQERAALLNEMGLASQVIHPNVIRVLHTGDDPLTVGPYLVMEFIEGPTLKKLLASLTAPDALPRARALMVGIAEGTKAINEKVIHRDIKNDNIIVTKKDVPKIGDLGIAKIVSAVTRTATFKGGQHVRYMAPEGWAMAQNTPKLDVYSVGLVFYEMLTGEHPLLKAVKNPNDWQHWRDAHLYAGPDDLATKYPHIPLELRQLLPRMVAKRPQERPDWTEIIRILQTEAVPVLPTASPLILGAVEAAARARDQAEAARAKAEKEQADAAQRLRLYEHACRELVTMADTAVAEFNSLYQGGSITKASTPSYATFGPPGAVYRLPGQIGEVRLTFFPQPSGDVRIRDEHVIGGGLLESHVSGVNLVLVKDSNDDLYGRWVAFAIRINAIAGNPARFMREYSLTTVPFGFKRPDDLWKEIYFAGGGLHVFTYERREDVADVIRAVLKSAVTGPDGTDRI